MRDFIIKNVVKENETGRELLYLCKFGSHLYGTNTPSSDVDYKGIFLPSKKEMLIGNKCKSLKYNTGKDSSRNTKEDLDVDLWSLQYFLELVGQGEPNSIDLLYSITHDDCVLYCDDRLFDLFNNPLSLFDPRKTKSFMGYAVGQAKKYDVKGSKLGILKGVYELLLDNLTDDQLDDERLEYVVNKIYSEFHDESYCFYKMVNNAPSLVLCGKVHMYSITLREFFNRVKREYEKYGDRAKKAEEALSHAMRSIYQMEELLDCGSITFPLRLRDSLRKIKEGKYTWQWQQVEPMIVEGLDRVELKQDTTSIEGKKNQNFVDSIILNFYGEKHG